MDDKPFVAKRMFFTKGKGVADMQLSAFAAALREAGIERFNLVRVSSIIPPNCELVKKEVGLPLLSAGAVTFVVLSRMESNEPNRLIAASIGMARPVQMVGFGYLSEYKVFGETEEVAGSKAEGLASTMLAATRGEEGAIGKTTAFKTANIAQSAVVGKDGRWTCTIAAAVLIL